jgi:hypothetical protein
MSDETQTLQDILSSLKDKFTLSAGTNNVPSVLLTLDEINNINEFSRLCSKDHSKTNDSTLEALKDSYYDYEKLNLLKTRLLHLIQEDLLNIEKNKQDNIKVNNDYNSDIGEELEEILNLLEGEVHRNFNLSQKNTIDFWLNLNDDKFNNLFFAKFETVTVIREKFKKLAIIFHPDKNIPNQELLNKLFSRITELKNELITSISKDKKCIENYEEEGKRYFEQGKASNENTFFEQSYQS